MKISEFWRSKTSNKNAHERDPLQAEASENTAHQNEYCVLPLSPSNIPRILISIFRGDSAPNVLIIQAGMSPPKSV